jgi:hypothetical protein
LKNLPNEAEKVIKEARLAKDSNNPDNLKIKSKLLAKTRTKIEFSA